MTMPINTSPGRPPSIASSKAPSLGRFENRSDVSLGDKDKFNALSKKHDETEDKTERKGFRKTLRTMYKTIESAVLRKERINYDDSNANDKALEDKGGVRSNL